VDKKETEVTSIRVYGLNKENKSVCLRIEDFTPYVYIELPTHIKWSEGRVTMLCSKLDFMLKQQRPLVKCFLKKYKLYYYHPNSKGKRKKFPYLFCAFSSVNDITKLSFMIKNPIVVSELGLLNLKMHEYDYRNVSNMIILQITSQRNIPTAGWFSFSGKLIPEEEKRTVCDYEYIAKWKSLTAIKRDEVAEPLVLSFDIEVNSSNPSAMPSAIKPNDKVFQISCVFGRNNSDKFEKYLLSLGSVDESLLENTKLLTFQNEGSLIIGFKDLILEKNPQLIIGYNILGFDMQYLIERAIRSFIIEDFDQLGCLKNSHAEQTTISWSSSAYKNQEFKFLDAEGRLFVDLLPLIRRDYSFNNYKLKTISTHFLGQTKDPLTPQGIFKCYRIGMDGGEKGKKALGICGKYCVQDSVLVFLLFNKLAIWIGLCEMAKTCHVPPFYLYTKGQQIKVYAQVYKKCTQENIIVERNAYISDTGDHYAGAMVFPPEPGLYERVVPFDFSSLYPTMMIANNIDYSTLVRDDTIPDEECHVIEWEDHFNCEHDPKSKRLKELTTFISKEQEELKSMREKRKTKRGTQLEEIKNQIEKRVKELKPYSEERSNIMKSKSKHDICIKRKYRFIKGPLGVLPSLLSFLLEARDHTKKEMKEIKSKLAIAKTDEEKNNYNLLLIVLDKRQLSYKVSANSMYGAMGVRNGMLPFAPGAMSTTAMGRKSISLVAKTIPEKFGGVLVYGDTDSSYISFPQLEHNTAAEIWKHAEMVSVEVSKLFPKPMKLAFEETIYWRFLILTKKRYMSLSCTKEGEISEEIKKKGVLLARRDNSLFIRELYGNIILKIFDKIPRDDIIYYILQEINNLCAGVISKEKFIVTQSVGNINNLQPVPFINPKGKKKLKIGDYTVPLLSEDNEERESQLLKKEAENETEFYLKCLPSAVQLAEKMRRRGQRVDPGSRLEYIVARIENIKGKKYEKVESVDYFMKHSSIITLDYLYYLKQLVNPLDQILNILYHKKDPKFPKDFMMQQYKYRFNTRRKLIEELDEIFTNKIELT